MTTIAELPAGFADKVLSAQSTFRSVMDAMARPGSVQQVVATVGTPGPMMRGTAAIALTLVRSRHADLARCQDVGDGRSREVAEVSQRRAGRRGRLDLPALR